jgi:hypothetical protein
MRIFEMANDELKLTIPRSAEARIAAKPRISLGDLERYSSDIHEEKDGSSDHSRRGHAAGSRSEGKSNSRYTMLNPHVGPAPATNDELKQTIATPRSAEAGIAAEPPIPLDDLDDLDDLERYSSEIPEWKEGSSDQARSERLPVLQDLSLSASIVNNRPPSIDTQHPGGRPIGGSGPIVDNRRCQWCCGSEERRMCQWCCGSPRSPLAGEKENVGFFALVEVKKEAKSAERNEFVPQRARFWLTKDPALNIENGVAIFEMDENTTGTAETYWLLGRDIELAYGENFPSDVTSTTIRKQHLNEGAFLRGAHLRELGDAWLKEANLESANLQGANLWLADL